MSNFGKNFVIVILSFIGLFSFLVPVIYTLLLIFKLVDTSDWNENSTLSSVIIIYIAFWLAALVSLELIWNLLKPDETVNEEKKEN